MKRGMLKTAFYGLYVSNTRYMRSNSLLLPIGCERKAMQDNYDVSRGDSGFAALFREPGWSRVIVLMVTGKACRTERRGTEF